MKIEILRTINLDEISKRSVELVLKRLGVSEEQANSKQWNSLRQDVLADLVSSDKEVFIEVIAESFSSQLHEALVEKANEILEDGAE